MSDFGGIIFVELFNTKYVYDMNLGGTEVLSVKFNKTFLLLFVANFGTVPQRHYMHP